MAPQELDADSRRLRELEAGFRDLTSLLALPALWSGGDPGMVARTLCEALEAVLPVDLVYLREEGVVESSTARVRGEPLPEPAPPEWRRVFRTLEGQTSASQSHSSPIGPLTVARAQISFGNPRVALWVGSLSQDFPRPTQLAYLVAAASLAASGLGAARLLAEREHASRLKDEFLAMLGHELRNPLAAISSSLSLLALKAIPEVDFERQVIGRQAKHLTRLVDDLVDVARVAKGKIDLRIEDLALDKVVEAALESVHPLIAERQHVVTVDVSSGLAVRGDAERLQQVLSNILTNAAKYTERGGHIELRAAREGGSIRIRISDNGVGIEPELLPHIFEPFTQGRRAPDRAAGGLGIGLALVQALVRLHGGEVQVESGGSARGSIVTVRIPAAQSARTEKAALPIPQQKELRVLIVDDNVDAASTLAALLRLAGHETHVAHDATAASVVLESFAADVVLIDIGLPGIDGRAFARSLRERLGRRSPRLVALSGYGQPEDRAKSLAAGIEQHLVKPVDPAALLAALAGGSERPLLERRP